MTQLIAKARIALNANYILSSWVYLDDLDTSRNILYVGVFILSPDLRNTEMLTVTG